MDFEELYQKRLARYMTAMHNGLPDRVPIRPFVAEFVAKYAGYTCQQVTHDYEKAFEATLKCCRDFDWDATVPNMVYVWTGLTQAIGLKYYAIPGIDIPPDVGFQYIEPPEERAFMKADEYDQLIEDPTAFLYNVWLPRVSSDIVPIGKPSTYRNNLSFVKGGMAMLKYFTALGTQVDRMRKKTGTVSAIAGILKAPFDIIADKLRGYIGLTMDMFTQPEKVLKACEALQPHLFYVALTTADPNKQVPIGFWMHRGCVPFVNMETFRSYYWSTLKPIIEELWKNGHQVLFYAEGNWDYHLDSFRELPEGSIIYHVDKGDIFTVKRKLGDKFCISGGLPNTLLSDGTPEEVRAYCKRLIDEVAQDGGYIMDASAIIQNDARVENIKAMTDFTREYGVYSRGHSRVPERKEEKGENSFTTNKHPGICIPWEEKRKEIPQILGDEELCKRIWEEIEALSYSYIWQILVSF